MMKKLFYVLATFVSVLNVNGQTPNFTNYSVDFRVQSNGTFLNGDGKRYIEIPYPGYSQAELYYAYLVTIEHKCVSSGVQYATVTNKCINVYSYEKYFESYGIWSGGFAGYLYYKFMFQFKDGKVRIEEPIVDHLGNGSKNTLYMKFVEMLHNSNRPLFNPDGTVVAKREKDVAVLNFDLNSTLFDIILAANSVLEWQH